MSVYQVEEFYLCTTGLSLNDKQKKAIEDHLSNEGYSSYEFQDGGQLVVDDIESECAGEELESRIDDLIEENAS